MQQLLKLNEFLSTHTKLPSWLVSYSNLLKVNALGDFLAFDSESVQAEISEFERITQKIISSESLDIQEILLLEKGLFRFRIYLESRLVQQATSRSNPLRSEFRQEIASFIKKLGSI